MTDPVRWGVLGTGKIAAIMAAAIADSSNGTLVAVGSRNAERSEAFASRFRVARHYGMYEEVLQDAQVEVVHVATHHPSHREWAVSAADAGKHLLCEKPLAVRHADAVQVVEAARRNDVHLVEAFAYRCHPQTDRLIELLRGGRIGDVRMIDATFGYDAGPQPTNYLMDRKLAGGSILDVGCYVTSMAHLVAAAAADRAIVEAVDVAAAGHLGPTGVDQSTAATLLFESGTLARVACSIQANLENTVRIYGSAGRITVPSPWLPGLIDGAGRLIVEPSGGPPETVDFSDVASPYTIEVDALNDLVRTGERTPSMMTWEESLENMHTLDRWRAAIGLRFDGDEAAQRGEF